jgi:predicted P-loop ATPase
MSAQAIAAALGGKVGAGGWINVPAPGHSPDDASLGIMLDPQAPGGYRVNPRAGEDPIRCRDYVMERLGLDPWTPKGDGGTSDDPVHPTWGKPDSLYWYRDAEGVPVFAVARWEASGRRKKEIRPVVKRDGRWLWQGMKGQRPLYGLRRLLEQPTLQVLMVEGEKKCDAAQALLNGLCVVTWSGGGGAHEHTDLGPLTGRSVVLWPDNDDPGKKAMAEIAARIEAPKLLRIIEVPKELPAKWDVGDAVAEGWDVGQIIEFARKNAKPWTAPPPTNVVALRVVAPPDANWRANLVFNESGVIKPRVANNFRWLLARHHEVAGCWAWDEMASTVVCAKPGPWDGADWQRHAATDADILQAMYWLERKGLAPRHGEVKAALPVVAREHPFHPIRDYLNGLKWDGVARLTTVPKKYFGSELIIHAVFFMRWMVSAVARIMAPGCKADSMIVLEGAQERMKSTLLKMLSTVAGIAYFTDSIHDIETKDGSINLQGVWVAEIAELNAFQRKDADAVKSWLSRSSDRYRVPWGSIAEDFPRQCVIAGTMNPSGSGYLRDPTGARRFWPVPVRKAIDIAAIEAIRDQLWAEAVHLYKTGTKWYLTEDEVRQARDITEERYEEDPWGEMIEVGLIGKMSCTTNQMLKLVAPDVERHSKAYARRVNDHLRRLGWVQKVERDAGRLVRRWYTPTKDDAPSPPAPFLPG